MRALLIANHHATATSHRVRHHVASILRSRLSLEVATTDHRHHATELAEAAVADGFDAVLSLGGDGTANEVLQALAGTDVAMGVIPGGGTNVLARALGLPNGARTATRIALDHLVAGRERRIGLGRANGRWFGFCAGFGFDAAVVASVEANPDMKRRYRQAAFVWLATREWFVDREQREPRIRVALPDGSHAGPYAITIVGNTDPYTYLGALPMRVTPKASFDLGLDVTAVRQVSTARLLGIVGQVFSGGGHLDDGPVDHWHDLPSLTLTARMPCPLMVDGDAMGDHLEVRLEATPRALRVLA